MNFYVAAILRLLHECDLDRETNVPKHMHDGIMPNGRES